MFKQLTFLFIALNALSGTVIASDKAKEKRWADQIVDAIMVGEAQWLELKDHKILGIYTEATTAKVSGAALVLHGSGVHHNSVDRGAISV